MIILAVIALITFPVIDNSIKSSREKSLERTIDSIEEAAYRYSIENDIGYPSKQQALYLSDIQSKGFLSSSIINPVTNEELSGCVWYYWDTTYNQYVFEYDMECVKVDTPPEINVAYDENLINSNGWAKENIAVTLSGNGDIKYCISSSECEPNEIVETGNNTKFITTEGTSYLCALTSNSLGSSNTLCQSFKLDKTLPTAGTASFTGTLGSNYWYTSNVTISVTDGSDNLSGHSSTISNIESITSNTTGTTIRITTTDLAGNSASRDYLIKVDKNSPTLTAKDGVVEITEGDSNVVSNYFNVSYSVSSGSLSCSPTNTSTLTAGTQTLSCTATGGNGLTTTASKEIFVFGSLIDILMQQYDENNITGLVQDETNPNIYYYTGTNEQVSNNYLWYGGHHWRVLEIDTTNNTLLLISQQPLTVISPENHGTIWTTEEEYQNSYINDWLNDYFYNSLDSNIKNNIVNNIFNVGIYTNITEITISQKVGLLDQTQYTRAGGQDSYLNIEEYWWLGNPINSHILRFVFPAGNIFNIPSIASMNPTPVLGVRAVIKISDINIISGKGTLEANYDAGVKAMNTNDIKVGEYINVPYSGSDNACGSDNLCTFRVVSKDNDSIKVILNGLLPNTSIYGNTATITTSHTVYTPLNTFANNISSNYRYTGNKIFYIGDYTGNSSYTDVQDETLQANVGLPTVGEMFSGNDIDLGISSTKTFVNIATIENPTVSHYYWTMNRYSSSYVRYVDYYGYPINNGGPTNAYGVRPVIFLKNNLTFTSGKGTAEFPYELE